MRYRPGRRGRIFAAALIGTLALLHPLPALGVPQRVANPPPVRRGFRERPAVPGIAREPSSERPYWACPNGFCEAIVDPPPARAGARFRLPGGPTLEGGGEKGGFDPEELEAAYRINTGGGEGQTVALVEAYGYPEAEADLAKYRERYGLGPCTHANGCFRKVNQRGEEGSYPSPNKGWEGETALDLDMASAACPRCHLLVVEAKSQTFEALGEAVATAVRLRATVVSNSYGAAEQECGSEGCAQFAPYYSHPGVVITVSSGDAGYDNHYAKDETPSFPATLPNVIAVGGTALHKTATGRGFSETVWNEERRSLGSGSGCSVVEEKPSWQHDSACPRRMDNDVAAVAACETPVSVYVSAYGGFENFCGTSASAPLVAGIEAQASAQVRALGASVFYERPADAYDVVSGANGTCTPPAQDEYFCTAEVGYDGPTGIGAPDGAPLPPAPALTKISPALGPLGGGTRVTVEGTHLANATAVYFGSKAGSEVVAEGENRLSVTAPAFSAPEAVALTVEGPGGRSAATLTYYGGVLPTYEGSVGVEGIPGSLLSVPGGDLWLAQWYENRLVELTPKGETVRTVAALEGSCTGSLEGPFGLALGAGGDLWLVDSGHDRLLELSPEGRCLREVGGPGEGAGRFSLPTAIAVGPEGKLYVADTGNARIDVFSSGGSYLTSFGTFGSGPGELEWPVGVAVSSRGTVYVADLFDNRLELFSTAGTYLGARPLKTPFYLALDGAENLFAVSLEEGYVAEYNAAAELVGLFSPPSGRWPAGLAVAGTTLWLAQQGGEAVVRFGGVP